MTQTAKNMSKSDQAVANSKLPEQSGFDSSDTADADFGLLLKNQSAAGSDEPPPNASDAILRQLQTADSAALNRKVLRLQKTVGNKSVSRLLTEYQIRRRFAANLHLPDLTGSAKTFKDNVTHSAGEAAESAVSNVSSSLQNSVSENLVNPAVSAAQQVAAPALEAQGKVQSAIQAVPGEMPTPADLSNKVVAHVPAAAPIQAGFEQAKTLLDKVQDNKPAEKAEKVKEATSKAVPQTKEVAPAKVAASAKAASAEEKAASARDPQLAQAAKGKPEDNVKPADMVASAEAPTAPKAKDTAGFAETADQVAEKVDIEKPFEVPKLPHTNIVIQRIVDTALEPPKLKPPLAPQQDPDFVGVKQKAQATAKKEQAHDPAKSKANEAQGAAVPPSNEVSSQAGGNQVGKMNQQEAGTFDKAGFVAAVRKAVEAITPKSEDEADEFKSSGKAGQVKQQVSGLVGQNKETAEKNIETTSKEAPNTGEVKPKQVTPMQNEKPGSAPGSIGAEGGMPKPKDAAETSLEYGPNKLNKQMEDAKVTEEQLQKSNEPTFQTALTEKKKVEQEAQTKPQQFRQDEKALIDKAKADAKAEATTSLTAMHSERTDSLTQVDGGKEQTKSKDEQERAKIAGDLEKIYGKTKEDVTKILDGLDGKVNKEFDSGEGAARSEFENYVKNRMDAYKDERYGGLFGWTNRVVDAFAGMPPEVNAFYTEGRNLYLSKMDSLIGRIADIVGAELTAAKNRIAQGLQEVQKYVKALPKNLQQIGLEAQQDIQDKFDELKSSVDEKQNSLVDTLAQRYVESRNAVDARIKQMQEENKGLVAKAIDTVKGVIDTILQLKDMLLGVLARAASAIDKILKDPIGFLSNLLNAIKGGLRQFVSNIGTHLKAGLIGWLTGTLGEAGLTMPATFDLKGILDLVLQIMGLTWQNIRGRIVKATSEKFVSRLEKAAEVIMILLREGPVGLWKYIQGEAENIKTQVIEGIKEFVVSKVITAGVGWLVSLFNPAGAFIAAARTIIAVIQFIMERGSQIMSFVNSILDSVEAIASGNTGGAANAIEQSLAKALPLAISFLANLLGLGGISQKIKNIIAKVQKPVNNAIDKVIKATLTKFKNIFKKEDEKKHKEMAKEAISSLEKTPAVRPLTPANVIKEKQPQAKQLEAGSVGKLATEDNVKMTVKFDAPDPKATKLKFTVVIAPNDTTGTGTIDVVPEDLIKEAKEAAKEVEAIAKKAQKAQEAEETRKKVNEISKKVDADAKSLEKNAAEWEDRKNAESAQRAASKTSTVQEVRNAVKAAKQADADAQKALQKMDATIKKIEKAKQDITGGIAQAQKAVKDAEDAVNAVRAAGGGVRDAKKEVTKAKKALKNIEKMEQDVKKQEAAVKEAQDKVKKAVADAQAAMKKTQELAKEKEASVAQEKKEFDDKFKNDKLTATTKPSLQYGQLDQHGRSTGALAVLGPDQAGKKDAAGDERKIGTDADFDPAGWPKDNPKRMDARTRLAKARNGEHTYTSDAEKQADIELANGSRGRAHLLANQLGGSGKDPRNLTTTLQDGPNTPEMVEIEKRAKAAAENGRVMYKVTPLYKGDNHEPYAVLMEIRTHDGVVERYEVPNKRGAKAKRLN